MDIDELMRLRGQQVTLEKERNVIRGQVDTERTALESFVSRLRGVTAGAPHSSLSNDWLEAETARLRRIADLLQRREQIDEEVANLKRFTGH